MKNEEFRELVDRDLSGLEWDERRRRNVLRALEGEERPVRKISTTFLIAAVVLCLSVTALAAGLIFSPKYDAVRLANDAVKAKYGLTDELIGILCRRAEVREDGTATVTYEAFDENDFPADRIGIYTVDVKGNHADASWSHDGDSTEGGLTAEAYGAEQLTMLAYHYGETLDEMTRLGIWNAEPREPDSEMTPEKQEEYRQAMAESEMYRRQDLAEAEKAGTVTVEGAAEIARKAIAEEYHLTADQAGKLNWDPEDVMVLMEEGDTVIELIFGLRQGEAGGPFTEGDGMYYVDVDLLDGRIEDILYDPGLGANE